MWSSRLFVYDDTPPRRIHPYCSHNIKPDHTMWQLVSCSKKFNFFFFSVTIIEQLKLMRLKHNGQNVYNITNPNCHAFLLASDILMIANLGDKKTLPSVFEILGINSLASACRKE